MVIVEQAPFRFSVLMYEVENCMHSFLMSCTCQCDGHSVHNLSTCLCMDSFRVDIAQMNDDDDKE